MMLSYMLLFLNIIFVFNINCVELPLKAAVYLPFEYLAPDSTTPGGTYVATAYGDVSVVPGVVGNALYIAGDDLSKLWLGDRRDSCFWSPGLCTEGYTIAFWLNMGTKRDGRDRYYFSNGGQNDQTFGIDFHLGVGDTMRYSIKTFKKKWMLTCEVTSSVWHHFALIWSEENGAKSFLNGEKCNERVEPSMLDNQPTTVYNDFYIGTSSFNKNTQSGEGIFDELLFWPEKKENEFISSLYRLYHPTNELVTRTGSIYIVSSVRTHRDKKLVDDVGHVVTAKSLLDCTRKCFTDDVMCMVAEWTETNERCRLANVVVTDPLLTNQIGAVIYVKRYSYP